MRTNRRITFVASVGFDKELSHALHGVDKENSAKQWNCYSHFSRFITAKKNETIKLKDRRFNRLNDCCLVLLYHIDDIAEYLIKFEQVTNNKAILDRSFVDIMRPF